MKIFIKILFTLLILVMSKSILNDIITFGKKREYSHVIVGTIFIIYFICCEIAMLVKF